MSEPGRIDRSLAEEAETVLRLRAEALARAAEQESVLQRTGLLVFRVGAHWYAVHVEGVREILQDYEVAPVPCVPDFVRGVLSVRGEIVSVTDAARQLGIVASENGSAASAAIVLENDECTTALIVDEVGGIVDVPASGVEPPLPHIDKAQAAYVSATVFLGDKLVSLINIDRILQPIDASAS